MTQIERAARALYAASNPESDENDQRWKTCIAGARAVIEAIRVPSPEMVRTGRMATRRGDSVVSHHDVHVAYMAMMDCVSEEGRPPPQEA